MVGEKNAGNQSIECCKTEEQEWEWQRVNGSRYKGLIIFTALTYAAPSLRSFRGRIDHGLDKQDRSFVCLTFDRMCRNLLLKAQKLLKFGRLNVNYNATCENNEVLLFQLLEIARDSGEERQQ